MNEATTTIEEKAPTLYEFAYVLKVEESLDSTLALLNKYKGQIKNEFTAKEITLAYPIEKQTRAQFGYLHLTFEDSEVIKELTNQLNLEEGLLRFLFVKVPVQKSKLTSKAPEKIQKETSKDEAIIPSASRIDSLTNEKLEETLEEILK